MRLRTLVFGTLLLLQVHNTSTATTTSSCLGFEEWLTSKVTQPKPPFCPSEVSHLLRRIYLLYDINPPEGFNLRRDVYIRLAVFVRQLQRRRPAYRNLRLVLPPWRRLYHWKSHHLQQDHLPWSDFFDVESLRRYAPVLDFPEFLQEVAQFGWETEPGSPRVPVHKVLQLQHFREMFENGVFHDKWEFASDCDVDDARLLQVSYLSLPSLLLTDPHVQCVRYQGSANLLSHVLHRTIRSLPSDDDAPKVVALLNAEVVLHDHWGDREFWRARRSMRFAQKLSALAKRFRRMQFNSTDTKDRVQRPPMWEYEVAAHRGRALGGNYLAAHLRRGDFVYGRESTTPTLKSAALQIKDQLRALNLSTVFLATDATAFEMANLKSHLKRVRVVRFAPEDLQQKADIKDGGIAIIDQLICAHARHFIGTYESTFTYRIYEEREILGFARHSTFNTFCKHNKAKDCSENSVWPIVY